MVGFSVSPVSPVFQQTRFADLRAVTFPQLLFSVDAAPSP
jgi:hypothetical protein